MLDHAGLITALLYLTLGTGLRPVPASLPRVILATLLYVAAAGAATVSIGTVAGSGAASILAATGKASLGTNALVVPTAVATPFKMSAASKINVTSASGPLTAGVIEVWALYTTAAA